MEFFNPITLFFLFTLQSVNLHQLDDQMAQDLSGQYVRETISESVDASACPRSFNIDLISAGSSEVFFLINQTFYQDDYGATPRILPVDGKSHLLYTGQLVRAEVEDHSSINVHVYNKAIPGERILETFKFNDDGTLFYETSFYDDAHEEQASTLNDICPGARYKKVEPSGDPI